MARNNSDENNTPKQKPTRRSPRGKKGAQSEPTSSSNKPNQADNTPSFAQRMKAFFSRFTPSLTSVALTALVGAGVFFCWSCTRGSRYRCTLHICNRRCF